MSKVLTVEAVHAAQYCNGGKIIAPHKASQLAKEWKKEAPDLELAKKFVRDKRYLWNSGIFLFKASVFLKELEKFEPEILRVCRKSLKNGLTDFDFFRVNQEAFEECPNQPIDIALMEKTKLGSVLTLKAGWDDIGSWKSLWKNSKKDDRGNALKGKVIIEDSENCYLRSEDRLIVGININDLVIVETNDAV